MSFAAPLALLALLAIPPLAWVYRSQQRAGARAAQAFAAPSLMPSVAPRPPGWRRHVPLAVLALALVALIGAAARPQRSTAVPLTDGAVMLADDVSSSMAATDVSPSRLGAAQRAAARFIDEVPGSIRVGMLQFNQQAVVLQSPTRDHELSRDALTQLHTGGHTAIGDAIDAALAVLTALRAASGARPPGAIVLISDGTSTVGVDPLAAARRAAAARIPIYTVAVGTAHGTIIVGGGSARHRVPVPISSGELAEIAQLAGGRTFVAGNSEGLSAVYAHLAKQLGHKRVKRDLDTSFAGAGMALLVLGGVLSLGWFGRLV